MERVEERRTGLRVDQSATTDQSLLHRFENLDAATSPTCVASICGADVTPN
jgi:hypothetical protein